MNKWSFVHLLLGDNKVPDTLALSRPVFLSSLHVVPGKGTQPALSTLRVLVSFPNW